jgi:hypothetical protein
MAAAANKAPPAFARAAAAQCPRTAYDQEVVMPQDGQRTPNNQTDVHGGSPSCLCVPNPLGSGRNQPATTSGTAMPSAATISQNRRTRLKSLVLGREVGPKDETGNEPENIENRQRRQEHLRPSAANQTRQRQVESLREASRKMTNDQ